MPDHDDVDILVASVKNSLFKKNYLVAFTKMMELKHVLKSWNLDDQIDPLISNLAALQRRSSHEQDSTVLAAKLDEVEAMVP